MLEVTVFVGFFVPPHPIGFVSMMGIAEMHEASQLFLWKSHFYHALEHAVHE